MNYKHHNELTLEDYYNTSKNDRQWIPRMIETLKQEPNILYINSMKRKIEEMQYYGWVNAASELEIILGWKKNA